MNNKLFQITKIKHLEYIILSLILVLAFLARLYKINNPVADWHSFRQADTASVSRTFANSGINLLYPRYHDISTTQSGMFNPSGYRFVEFPLYNAIHAVLFKFFPFFTLEIWGRLISVLSVLISAYTLFLLGRKFIGAWGGVLAAFFYSLLPFNVYFTRTILPEPLAISFALLSVWTFVKFVDEEKDRHLYVSFGLLSLAVLIKPFTIFYGLPMAYLAIKKRGFEETVKDKRFYKAAIIVLVPFFLWRIWMQQFPEGIPFWKWTFNGDGIRFRPAFWRWIFGERLSRLILGYWGLVPFSFGILALDNKVSGYASKKYKAFTQHQTGFGFIHFFLLGMFLYVVVFATANVRHDYYQAMIIPAVSLALAEGTLTMWGSKTFNKLVSRGLLIFSIFLMMGTSAYQVREFYKINRPEIVKAGEATDRITPKDALVIAPYNGDTAFLYQTKRWGWPVVDRPIDELIEKGANYFVSVDLDHPQTKEFEASFEMIEITPEYLILDLNKERK